MRTGRSKILLFKTLALLAMLLLGIVAFSGCRPTTSVPKGWSGGAIADGNLFIGSMEGNLVAVSIADGSNLWKVPLEAPPPPTGGFSCAPPPTTIAIYGSPAVAGNLVYVGGYNGKIYAFTAESGALRWVYPRQGIISDPVVGGIIASQGRLYFGSANGNVYALDAETGDLFWTFEIGKKIWSTPAVNGDTLFIGSFDNKLYAIDTATGKATWAKPFETNGAIVATAMVDNDTVYFGSFDRYLYAVDITSGEQIWRFPATNEDEGEGEDENRPGNWFWTKPVIHDGVLYTGNLDGKVYAIDAESGDMRHWFDLGSPVESSPVLIDDLIIVVTGKGVVYTLDTANNKEKQLIDLAKKVYAPLVTGQGNVYIHTEEDTLHEIDVLSGASREFSIKSE